MEWLLEKGIGAVFSSFLGLFLSNFNINREISLLFGDRNLVERFRNRDDGDLIEAYQRLKKDAKEEKKKIKQQIQEAEQNIQRFEELEPYRRPEQDADCPQDIDIETLKAEIRRLRIRDGIHTRKADKQKLEEKLEAARKIIRHCRIYGTLVTVPALVP